MQIVKEGWGFIAFLHGCGRLSRAPETEPWLFIKVGGFQAGRMIKF
jgi:hypothetical protein